MEQIYVNRDNRKPQYNTARAPVVKPFYNGQPVYVNVSHPQAKNILYTCKGVIIRMPRNKSEEKYKILITGVRAYSDKDSQTHLKQLIGMKIVRHAKAISKEEPWVNTNQSWLKVDTKEEGRMFRLAVSAIKKEPYRQSKNRPVPRLD